MKNNTYLKLKYKRVTVMGLGVHGGGVAVVKWLAIQGSEILVTDLRDKKQLHSSINQLKQYKIKYVLGLHRVEDFKKTDLVIKNPGVPKNSRFLQIARKNNIPIETDISLFFQLCPSKIIGITGSKGKSTTTTLIYEFLRAAGRKPFIAGNIRISPLPLLSKLNVNTPVVLELSSWQIEDMQHLKKSPHISIVTNIFHEHLDRHGTLKKYIGAKRPILKYQMEDDFAVLNYDNPFIKKFSKLKSKIYWFSLKLLKNQNGTFIKKDWIIFRNNNKEQIICPVKDIKLPGKHNIYNALASIAAVKILDVGNDTIRKTLKKFKGIPDRFELIRHFKGRDFFNDTTATAPEAVIAALSCFEKKVILIAGGADKKLSYSELAKWITKKTCLTILFKGTASNKLVKELKKYKYSKYHQVSNMRNAVSKAYTFSKKGDNILLSPGAASFGIFLNEFDRGDQFKKYVKQLR